MDKHHSICTRPALQEKIANPSQAFFNGFRSASQTFHIRFPAGIQRVPSVNAPLFSDAHPMRMRRSLRRDPAYPVRPLGKNAKKGLKSG
jgi:hypothetical protein